MLYSVLSVEDNPFLIQLLGYLLPVKDGFELEAVQTLVDALEKLKERRYDCILLDLHLPDSHGMETLKAIKARTKIPVIVLSGDDNYELKQECLQIGARRYIVKRAGNGPEIAEAIVDSASEKIPSMAFTGKAALIKRQVHGDLQATQIATYIAGGTAAVFVSLFCVGFFVDLYLQLRVILSTGGQYAFPAWALTVVIPALGLIIHFIFQKK